MKFSRLVLTVSLGILAASSSLMMAKAAKADGLADPNITIGKTSLSCGPTCDPAVGAADNDPLVITDDSGTTNFIYGGPDTAEFFVEIIPFAGEDLTTFENEIFTCTPGAGAATCGAVGVCTQNIEAEGADCPLNGPAQEFVFIGPKDGNGNPIPFIFTGDSLQIITAPEPSAILLLVIGLASLVGFGWRRRSTNAA